jgi:branched-chain amino acid transport system ATP-binding protein
LADRLGCGDHTGIAKFWSQEARSGRERETDGQEIILETFELTKEFVAFMAVSGINLRIERGTIHALIGPNGAGKTTCFNLLTKFLEPTSGRIIYDGTDITALAPADVARRGLVSAAYRSRMRAHPALDAGCASVGNRS